MLKVIDIGIVLQSPDGKYFRNIILKDADSLKESKYIVYKTNQPYLWKSIDKAENNKNTSFSINGKIEIYNGIDIVVFDGEGSKEAFEKQKWKLKESRKISRKEAKEKIKKSQGYITELNEGESMNYKLAELDKSVKRIRFRYYHTADKYNINKHSYFEWTDWFDIYD